jgi:DNA-directed RNA polymerase specialized sigma24 family protein
MYRRNRKPTVRATEPSGGLPPESQDASLDLEDGTETDRQLAKRCVAGEVAAWEEIYNRYHDSLCRAIRSMLGTGGADPSRVDEIAARVWYALVRNDGQLLSRFDPARHTRLAGFLRGLARVEIMQYYRAEHRRRAKEAACLCPAGGETGVSDWQVSAMIDDFASTLTVGEQEFLEEHLLGQSDDGEQSPSDATIWQRCHRIRKKLKAFFWGKS